MKDLNTRYDVIVVGAGAAGLNCALSLPGDLDVLVMCKDAPDISDSYLAQGGICCLLGEDDREAFFEDTMRAGHYENDPEAVRCMIDGSRAAIDGLVSLGVDFARNPDGTLAATREGGHSRNRICFHEDCTGKEITGKLLAEAMRRPNIRIAPYVTLLDLLTAGGECLGVVAWDNGERVVDILSDYTVLASGGIGGIYRNSTNFRIMTGDALAVCMDRGVALDHLGYVQIHPTTLVSKRGGRRRLITESVRGEGAYLLDRNFERFCDELAPRDVVCESIWAQMERDGTYSVWLDMRPIPRETMLSHFPGIVKTCSEEGYDVFSECVPVVPAQHYFMGGIRSDTSGRTTMGRLYAVGETCCNGVHGRNRLASNSLLESLVFSSRAARDIKAGYSRADEAAAAAALGAADPGKYRDARELLAGYRKKVRAAVEAGGDEDGRKEDAT